jgi:hypothetical protein
MTVVIAEPASVSPRENGMPTMFRMNVTMGGIIIPSANPMQIVSNTESFDFLRRGTATAIPGTIIERNMGIAAEMNSVNPN